MKFVSCLLLILIFNLNSVFANDVVVCKIKAELREITDSTDEGYKKIGTMLQLECIYDFNGTNDSSFVLSSRQYTKELGPQKLNISIFDDKNREINKTFFKISIKDGVITINNTSNKIIKSIVLKYFYIGSTFMVLEDKSTTKLRIFGNNDMFEHFNDMFFKVENKKVSYTSINVIANNDYTVFSSELLIKKKFYHKKWHVTYSLSNIENIDDLTLFFVNKNKYSKIDFRKNISLFVESDKKDEIEKELDLVNSKFDKIDFLAKPKCNVICMDWRSKHGVFGKTFKGLIIMDYSFLNKNSSGFVHEYLHVILNSQQGINDTKGDFILNESIIEYLSTYYTNSNRDSAFYKKMESFDYDDTLSSFDIVKNDKKSWATIYGLTPCIIYYIAKKIGFDEFNNSLFEFYTDKNKIKNYNTFIEFLKLKYNSETINELDSLLKAPTESNIKSYKYLIN